MLSSSLIQVQLRPNLTLTNQIRNHVKIYPWRVNRKNPETYLDPTKTPYTDRHNASEFDKDKKKKKPWQIVIPKNLDNSYNSFKWNDAYQSDPREAKETAKSKLKRFSDSLRDRGAARESKPYKPPENVRETIVNMYKSSLLSDQQSSNQHIDDEAVLQMDINHTKTLKFDLLSRCVQKFDHDLPSSLLVDINTVADIVEYFSTPVRGVNPYTSLLRQESSLPENLALISEPIRYDRENDDYFHGHSALPGNVSKVPGLRGAKKYPVLNQDEFQWPDV